MYLKCTNRHRRTAAGPRTSSWEHLHTAVPRHLERNTRTINTLPSIVNRINHLWVNSLVKQLMPPTRTTSWTLLWGIQFLHFDWKENQEVNIVWQCNQHIWQAEVPSGATKDLLYLRGSFHADTLGSMVLSTRWIAGYFYSTWIWIGIHISSAFHFSNNFKLSMLDTVYFKQRTFMKIMWTSSTEAKNSVKLINSSTEAKNSANWKTAPRKWKKCKSEKQLHRSEKLCKTDKQLHRIEKL